MKQHLYNALSGTYCFAYVAIWFGCCALLINQANEPQRLGLEGIIFLLVMTVIPFHIFEGACERLFEYGIYRKRLFLNMPISLLLITDFMYLGGILAFNAFWKTDQIVPFERTYGMVASASFLFSTALALLRWHCRSVPEMWRQSYELLKHADTQ